MSYSVINKGKLSCSKINNFISINQYLFVKEKGCKFLLLKLSNDRDEKITNIKIEISQKDALGMNLGTLLVDCPVQKANPQSTFVLNRKISLADNCVDFDIKIISAGFGNYIYTPHENELVLSYKKNEIRNNLDLDSPVKMIENENQFVSKRKFKVPVSICFFMIAMLMVSAIFIFFTLKKFMFDADAFYYSDVQYAFLDDNNESDYSPIYVIGSREYAENIVIPEKVKGHEVIGIMEGAFYKNYSLQKVTVKGSIEIKDKTFYDCRNLSVINIEKVTRIGDYAFENCASLNELNASNLSSIGKYAFRDCWNLKTIRITNSQSVLKIGESAFENCGNLSEISIEQFIDYSENVTIFPYCYGLEKLYLKNYNYSYGYNAEDNNRTILQLFGLSDYIDYRYFKKFQELIIDYCKEIPDNFCYNLPLASITINNLESTEVGNNAFYNCNDLEKLDVPVTFTWVGDFAFCKTAITEFDGNNLNYIGDNAFSECTQLSNFSLENNDELNYIGIGAFNCCEKLSNFYVPETISVINDQTFQFCSNLSYLTQNGDLQSIGGYAFDGCKKLTEVPITEQTTAVGEGAFKNCTSLKSISLKSLILIGADAFNGCREIESITVPQSVQSIGLGAFSNCTALKEISLPFIGRSTNHDKFFAYIFGARTTSEFYKVPQSLEKVTIKSATEINDSAFYNCVNLKEVVIESGYARIGNSAFNLCSNLNSFVIPSSVQQIGTDAFAGCYKLYEVYNLSPLNIVSSESNYGMAGYYALKVYQTIDQESIEKFNYEGFEFGRNDKGKWFLINYTGSDTSLLLPSNFYYNNEYIVSYEVIKYSLINNPTIEEVTISDSVTAIGEYSFYNCISIKKVTVSDSVQSIGLGAFQKCSSLKEITLPFVGRSSDSNRYFNYIFGADNYYNNMAPYSLKTVTITKATDIPDHAFIYCNFTSINLPNTVNTIGSFAFYHCIYLTSVDLPNTVNTIGSYAFSDCYNLEKVTLLGEVDIQEKAFYCCYNLYEVYNLSNMNIIKGSKDNGYIAYYAIAVNSSLQDMPLEEVMLNDIVYKHSGEKWAIVNYQGDASKLKLSSFIYQGKTVSSYSIKRYAFQNNYSIKELIIGKEVVNVDEFAFNNCFNLEVVNFENSVITDLKDYTFSNCSSLTSINLPENLTRIGSYAFSTCTQLYSLQIPENVAEIGDEAFYGCYALCDVYNFSKTLSIVKGSSSNGYVAYYALRVSASADNEPLVTFTANESRFIEYDAKWYMIMASKDNYLSLPKSIVYNGTTISSYILMESSIGDKNYGRIFIPHSVNEIQSWSLDYNIRIETIMYEGTAQEWATLAQNTKLAEININFNCEDIYG